MILVSFQDMLFKITVIQVCAPTSNVKEVEVEWFYEDLQDLLELTPNIHHRRLECKGRKSRDTWSNRQVCPWSTNEAGKRLTEFCQENTLVIANARFQ